ncbi:hypothetical protein AWR27_10090 [Spirosoma montaniterrae]|uniref:Glycosyltransferase RgtA/B/C/D-like domain-containing protein n=2 Tax=Spirosoma montaniterrae TaxID=1178516 RepID=A0A1P9WW87_9BACT|nr:hypothetical protein AWR27_10090 [Spirosoma montaniterrae]
MFLYRNSIQHGAFTAFRLAFIYASLVLCIAVFSYNEVFSYLQRMNAETACVFWSIGVLVGLSTLLWSLRKPHDRQLLVKQLSIVFRLHGCPNSVRWLTVAGFVLLYLPLLFLALYAPPSNLDSHNYHLNRILFWVWNQNLDHFPTVYGPQLYHNVFAEYVVMHTGLLTGSDQFVNLIQFSAMTGAVLSISLLAKEFGLNVRGQFLAGVLLFSLPIGLFESTTTQNDYITCYLFISFVVLGYRAIRHHDYKVMAWCLLALFFAGFTKYTALMFGLPFAVFFGINLLKQRGFVYSARILAMGLLLFGLIFGSFFYRNYQLYGSLIGPRPGTRLALEKLSCDTYSLPFTTANVLKNVGLHLGLPYSAYNRQIDSGMVALHRTLGVSLTEPAITMDHYHARFSMQEDMVPNTIHFCLLLLSSVFLFIRRDHGDVKILLILALLGFVLFCTLVKFQLWSSRTHMPLFAVGCVVIGYVVRRLLGMREIYLSTAMLLLSVVIVYGNPAKMLIPVRYVSQKLVAHVPRDISPPDSSHAKSFRNLLGPYYDTSVASIYPIRHTYSYRERQAIFQKLDSVAYFWHDKQGSILAKSRTEAYFANHLADYTSYSKLLPHIGPDVLNIGVAYLGENGFYHYWRVLNQPVQMRYIRYRHEFNALSNTHRRFRYNYILSDEIGTALRCTEPGNVAAVYKTDKLILVKLKRPSERVYLF